VHRVGVVSHCHLDTALLQGLRILGALVVKHVVRGQDNMCRRQAREVPGGLEVPQIRRRDKLGVVWEGSLDAEVGEGLEEVVAMVELLIRLGWFLEVHRRVIKDLMSDLDLGVLCSKRKYRTR